MRTILFRGKRLDNEDWVYGSLTHGENIILPSGKAYPIDPKTVGQYTGLDDKNNVKIFEDDVVKFCSWNDCEKNKEREWLTNIIEWDNLKAKFTGKNMIMDMIYSSFQYEVISNIHDNPIN